ncbi:MAG: hypothetical protein ACRBB0_17170 [Pelagimonas sp.]|uniref:hypothetical protein n=1 Tax=Pelagimonas sp. TaxID=2073170 RepID=UPI003D6AEC85
MAFVANWPISRAVARLFHPVIDFVKRTIVNSKNARHAQELALSDADLAERGLRRPDVVDRHFGDLFYS